MNRFLISLKFLENINFKIFNIIFIVNSFGCASKLLIQSDPPEAQVMVSVEGQEPKLLGVTPVETNDKELSEKLKVSLNSNPFIILTIIKDKYSSKTIYLPVSRWNQTMQAVKVKLKSNEDEGRVAIQILRHLFNAKKLVESRQIEQAHVEIDKALAIEPKLSYAMLLKGSAFYLSSQFDEASNWYKKALDVDPTQTEAIKMLEKLKLNSSDRGMP